MPRKEQLLSWLVYWEHGLNRSQILWPCCCPHWPSKIWGAINYRNSSQTTLQGWKNRLKLGFQALARLFELGLNAPTCHRGSPQVSSLTDLRQYRCSTNGKGHPFPLQPGRKVAIGDATLSSDRYCLVAEEFVWMSQENKLWATCQRKSLYLWNQI